MDVLFRPVLWGLLTLLIPVLVHLFFFRKHKKVQFTNVRLLKEVIQHSATRNRLKHLLILASRLLALGFLILAFAQPFLKKKDQIRNGQKSVSLFIDNSYSMQSHDEDIPLFEVARSKAREIVSAFDESDLFQIVTSSLGVKEKKWLNRSDAIEAIDDLEIVPESASMDQLVTSISKAQSVSDADHKLIYLLSDFQKNGEFDPSIIDTACEINLLPLSAVQNKNISVDSVWFLTPTPAINQKNELIIKLTNHDTENRADTKLNFSYDGRDQPIGQLTLQPGETLLDTASIEITKPGWQNVTLQITDYPISFDDKYHIAFEILERLNILIIKQDQRQFNYSRVFEAAPLVNLDEQLYNKIDYSTLKDYNLIVLHQLNGLSSGLKGEMVKNIKSGSNVLVIPQGDIDPKIYNDLLTELRCNTYLNFELKERTVGKINRRSTTFSQVYEGRKKLLDLPNSKGNYTLSRISKRRKETLISYRDGSPFLLRQPIDRGNVFIQTAPSDKKWSNYMNYVEIWIPMLYNMALPANQNGELAFEIGGTASFEVAKKNESEDIIYKITGQEEFIPQQLNLPNASRIVLSDQIKSDGFYDVKLGEDKVRSVAMNYNRRESSVDFFKSNELSTLFPTANILSADRNVNLAEIIQAENKGTPLWKYCVIATLLFLLVESLLVRFL